ncbi:hypothetical protein CapIbe_012853 [Capra ibex]
MTSMQIQVGWYFWILHVLDASDDTDFLGLTSFPSLVNGSSWNSPRPKAAGIKAAAGAGRIQRHPSVSATSARVPSPAAKATAAAPSSATSPLVLTARYEGKSSTRRTALDYPRGKAVVTESR